MAVVTILLLIISTLVGAIYLYYKNSYRFWKKIGFPHTSPSIPYGDIQGTLAGKSIGEAIDKVYQDNPNEKFIGMWLMFRPALLVRDPELVKNIFVRDFMSFHDRGIYVNEKDDPLSGHLFSISGTKWRNLRVKMTPTFTSGKMKMMFPILEECSKRLVKALDQEIAKEEVVEVKDFAARFTTDIISLCAFGIDTDSLRNPDSDFRHYGLKIFEPLFINVVRGLTQMLLPNLAKLLKIRSTRKDVSNFFLKAIRESMDYRENNKIKRNDFLELLIQLKNKGRLDDVDVPTDETKETKKFTFEEAAAQAFVFFLAGFETSSTTMQYALYELALNPDIQEKARQEALTVLKKHNNEISYEAASEMDYLSRVIDETLRLFPPVPFLQRECNKDYTMPGTDITLPEGTQVLIDVLGFHRDPKYYPNPERFDPERFTEEEKAKRHNYSYLPFGEGPRNCIGMRFGLLQTKVGLATLLANYTFSVCSKTLIPMEFDPKIFILTPKTGMYLKVSKLT